MDGKRPLLGEVQALVVHTQNPSPRRAVSGLDSARVAMVLAVLERRCNIRDLGKCDVYASTVGGMRITDPSADLALALAIVSAVRDQPVPPGTVLLGEVGWQARSGAWPGPVDASQKHTVLGSPAVWSLATPTAPPPT